MNAAVVLLPELLEDPTSDLLVVNKVNYRLSLFDYTYTHHRWWSEALFFTKL